MPSLLVVGFRLRVEIATAAMTLTLAVDVRSTMLTARPAHPPLCPHLYSHSLLAEADAVSAVALELLEPRAGVIVSDLAAINAGRYLDDRDLGVTVRAADCVEQHSAVPVGAALAPVHDSPPSVVTGITAHSALAQ
jgi:hypothetical protein